MCIWTGEILVFIFIRFLLQRATSIDTLWNVITCGLWWPALPGHWLSYTRCWQSLLVMYLTYDWDAVSLFTHLPRIFLSTGFAFRITDWTCCHGPHLHAILKNISRGVSGLATDSPCGVWGRRWTTCLLHDSPLFGSHFKMRVGM